jgi:AcrR family transcriptional regulator
MAMDLLLQVAVDQFGRLGFQGASTRAIAAASKTAMSSITYHYGGKEGLYLAAADHIAARIAEAQSVTLQAAMEMARKSVDDAREALLLLVESLALMMLRPESEAWARFIMREQQAPTEAFNRLYLGAMKPVCDFFVETVHRLRPDLGETEARASAVLVLGQAMALRAARAGVCRIMNVEQIDEDVSAVLRARLRAHVLCILLEEGA